MAWLSQDLITISIRGWSGEVERGRKLGSPLHLDVMWLIAGSTPALPIRCILFQASGRVR